MICFPSMLWSWPSQYCIIVRKDLFFSVQSPCSQNLLKRWVFVLFYFVVFSDWLLPLQTCSPGTCTSVGSVPLIKLLCSPALFFAGLLSTFSGFWSALVYLLRAASLMLILILILRDLLALFQELILSLCVLCFSNELFSVCLVFLFVFNSICSYLGYLVSVNFREFCAFLVLLVFDFWNRILLCGTSQPWLGILRLLVE